MGRGDFGFDGAASLKAVDNWIAVINSNLSSTSRVGYKGSKVKFKGGVTEVQRGPVGALQGIQLPESTISIDETNIDFSQGSIINSTESTHLAIQGKGFFALGTLDTDAVISYYTRDGEFHVVVGAGGANLLVHSTGLYLKSAAGNLMFLHQNGLVTETTANTVMDETDVVSTATPNFLRFSRYGSTVFETTSASATLVAVSTGNARVLQSSLETSNTSLSQSLPELSLAQKFFSAISKVISVHQTNLDTVLNLVR